MAQAFKVGDRVEWNSNAGSMSGTITQKVTTELNFKGYVRHASVKDPQFIIKTDTNNQEVMQRGATLRPARKNKALVGSAR